MNHNGFFLILKYSAVLSVVGVLAIWACEWIQAQVKWNPWKWATIIYILYASYLNSSRFLEESRMDARMLRLEQRVQQMTVTPRPERQKWTKPIRFPWQR